VTLESDFFQEKKKTSEKSDTEGKFMGRFKWELKSGS
jgi:hypothetical protein